MQIRRLLILARRPRRYKSLIANVWEPDGSGQYARDPRGVLLRAIKQLERVASGCLCKVGPELEFYIFDEVRYKLGQFETYVRLIEAESSSNSERTQSAHNRGYVLGHSMPASVADVRLYGAHSGSNPKEFGSSWSVATPQFPRGRTSAG